MIFLLLFYLQFHTYLFKIHVYNEIYLLMPTAYFYWTNFKFKTIFIQFVTGF